MSLVYAVILAAGFSRRLGMDKLSQDLCGRTVLQRCIDQVIKCGVARVYVVIREREQINFIKRDDKVRFVINEESASGMASSIKVAIVKLEGNPDAVLIVNGDMPFFGVTNYKALLELWQNTDDGIAATYYMGDVRNPVIFSRKFLPDLLTIEGDRGAKKIVQKNFTNTKFLEIIDPDYLIDIDTPEDLEYSRSMCNFFLKSD